MCFSSAPSVWRHRFSLRNLDADKHSLLAAGLSGAIDRPEMLDFMLK
jgi:hypothetical protein